jgi:protoheme IX farnesyltransferase
MFAIIFLWTPPHFWALALCLQEDYKANPLPMMPNVAGEKSRPCARCWFTPVALVGISLSLVRGQQAGLLYIIGCAVVTRRALRVEEHRGDAPAASRPRVSTGSLFGFSIVYLFALFFAMMADAAVR